MCPTDLPPPRRVAGVGAPALRHQRPPEVLPQQLVGHFGAARHPDHKHGDIGGDRGPPPRTRLSFSPAGLIQVSGRWLLDICPGLCHRLGHRLHGSLLQGGARPQPHLDAKQVLQGALRGPFRQMIGPCAQGRDRLDARAESPHWHTRGRLRAGLLAAGRTDQAVQLILSHDRLHGRDLGHLMPLGVRNLPLQRRLTAPAPHGFDRNDHIHRLHGQQRACLPLRAGLSTRATPRGLTPGPLVLGLGWVARRGARRGPRGLLHPLRQVPHRRLQALDGGLQCCHAGLEGADVVLGHTWDLIPHLLGERDARLSWAAMLRDMAIGRQVFLVATT